MSINVVLIINFSDKQNMYNSYADFQKIFFSFCSVAIEWFLKKIFFYQVAIVLAHKKITQQVCHFTDNNSHHTQGLRRCCDYVHNKNDINSAIILAKRLIDFTNQKKNSEIILVSSSYSWYGSLHVVTAKLVKNKIKFSVINFHKKSFTYEIMTKLTKGTYITWNPKKNNFFTFKYNFSLKKNLGAVYMSFGSENIKIHSFSTSRKTKLNVYKISRYCSSCKGILNNLHSERCVYCKLIFHENTVLNKNFTRFFKFEFLYRKFSIFNAKYTIKTRNHRKVLKLHKHG